MLFLRCVARASPRLSNRVISCSQLRLISSISRPSILRLPQASEPWKSRSAFSSFAARREAAGQYDTELAAKLGNEMSLEEDSRDSQQVPPTVQEFLENSAFKIDDVDGSEEVTLTRTFGDETIKVKFSIADMNVNQEPDQAENETALSDEDLYDDDASGQRGGAQSKGTVKQSGAEDGNIKPAPADNTAATDQAGLADEEDAAAGESSQAPAYPSTLYVTISKPGKGAMHVVTTAQDGMITIENVYYYETTEMAEAETPEADFARTNAYGGPPFQNLDPELQTMLERYLDERGINEQLANFVPDYVEYKEQREYVQWLQSMQSFIDG